MMLLIFALGVFFTSKIHSCPLDTKEKQCDYGNPYVLVSTSSQISFNSANEYCKTKYGTQLASIHSNSDKEKALELVNGKNHVWIGLYKNNVTSKYTWVDGTESDYYDWAKGQPTGGIEECVHIAPEKNYQWNDFPCIGYESISKWKVTDFLCANPLYDEDTACLCQCDICSVEGDPHFTTFDNLAYHFMGPCTYYYVTPCHPGNYDELPIEVLADHIECFPSRPGMTCIREVFVNLYDSTQNLAVQISLKEHLNVTYTSNGAVYKSGSVPVNKYVYFENKTNEHRAFYLTRTDGGNVDLQIYITDALEFKVMDARIVFASSFAPDGWGAFVDIYLAECFAEDHVTCGLCGYYDFDPTNDFTWYNSINNTFSVINSSGVSEIRGMGMDAWKRGNLFGSKWIEWDLTDELSCEVVSSPPETRCVEKAEVYCKKFWTDSCPCHDQAYYNNSWYQLCVYDTCALCPTLETLPYVNASKAGCFNIANASCYSEECTILGPTLPPTFVPTAFPTRKPTLAPTPRPTLKPTPRPTNAPTKAECHDVFAYDEDYNTCIDSIVDPWTNKDVCNNTRQDCGFTNGPYNCEVPFPRTLDLYANSYCNIENGVKIGSLSLNQGSDSCDISVVYTIDTNNIYTFEVNSVQLYVGKFPLYIDSTSSTGYSVNWNNYPLQQNRNSNSNTITWYLPQYLCGEFYLVAHAIVCTNPLAFI